MPSLTMPNKDQLVETISKWWDHLYVWHPVTIKTGANGIHDEIEKLAESIIGASYTPKPEVIEPEVIEHIDIQEKINELLLRIDTERFNGLILDVRKETIESWNADYAIFRVHDIENRPFTPMVDSDYAGFREDEFWYDFEKHIRDAFKNDPTVDVQSYDSIREFEITRKGRDTQF